jgi:type I restriction enzyme S subunit
VKKDWEIKKLNEVCEIECGTRVVRKVDGGTIFPVYGGGGATFKMDTYNRENCLIVSRFAMSEKCTRFVEGKFFLNDSGLSLRANENVIYQKYLETVILGKNDEIYSLGRGAAQKNLDMARFRELKISYPKSLEEQKRIVKILDEKFAQLESLKTNAQTNLQNTKDLFQSQLSKALSSSSNNKVVDLFDIKTGKLNSNAAVPDGKYPFFTCSREVFAINTYAFDCEAILLAGNNASGDFNVKHYCGKFNAYQRTYVITVKNSNETEIKLLYYVLENYLKQLKNMSVGANTRFLKLGMIQNLEYPALPLPEQKRIVKELDTLSEKVRQLQEIYTKQLANCDELKQSLLQKAFEGDL